MDEKWKAMGRLLVENARLAAIYTLDKMDDDDARSVLAHGLRFVQNKVGSQLSVQRKQRLLRLLAEAAWRVNYELGE